MAASEWLCFWDERFVAACAGETVDLGLGHVIQVEVGRPDRTKKTLRLTLTGPGGKASVATQTPSRVPPRVGELRRGSEVELADGRSLSVVRNGPRPLSVLRKIRMTGAGTEWVARGRPPGTEVRDDHD